MVTDDEEEVDLEGCECGNKKYGYYSEQGLLFICFKCGRFYSYDMPDIIIRAFTEDPTMLMALINSEYFQPITNLGNMTDE